MKAAFISAIKALRDKNVPPLEAASQLKASGQFDLDLFKEIILDESVQISVRQRAMFIGAASGDTAFIVFLANEFVLNHNPKRSLGMFSDAKDICEQHGMRFQ